VDDLCRVGTVVRIEAGRHRAPVRASLRTSRMPPARASASGSTPKDHDRREWVGARRPFDQRGGRGACDAPHARRRVASAAVSGERDFGTCRPRSGRWRWETRAPRAYLADPADAYAAADVVIARSALRRSPSSRLTGTPSILIPYPHAADGHQAHNAALFETAGAAVVIPDAGSTATGSGGRCARCSNRTATPRSEEPPAHSRRATPRRRSQSASMRRCSARTGERRRKSHG